MSQNDVYLILKKNPGMFMSARELTQLVDSSIQSVLANMKALEKDEDFKVKFVKGKTSHKTKMIAFVPRDSVFEVVLKDFTRLKLEGRFAHSRHDYLQNFMLITEVRKLRGELQDGK